MQTKQCEYCGKDIDERAYGIHLKLCPKRPGAIAQPNVISGQAVILTNKNVNDMTKEEAKVAFDKLGLPTAGNISKVEHPEPVTETIPEPGSPEYLQYWRSLDDDGQKIELARRKVLDTNFSAEAEELANESVAEIPATTITAIPLASAPEPHENGAMEIFYPKADPNFMVNENTVEALRVTEAISHKHPTNLLVTGQPGGGKTSLALQFAAKFNRPAVVADFGVLQEPQQLFQTTRLIQGEGESMVTDIRETGFVRGMETEGCVVIMDEINRPENERVLNVLMPLLDRRESCWIEDLRRRVSVARNVIFIATLNEGALFCGITSIDIALRDRFREVFLDYLPAEPESRVLEAKTGIPRSIANSLAEFAYTVRTTPTIGKKISTRQLLHAAEAYAEGTSLWQAVETAIGNYNDLAWRQQIMEVFSLSIKDEAEYKRWTQRRTDSRYVRY